MVVVLMRSQDILKGAKRIPSQFCACCEVSAFLLRLMIFEGGNSDKDFADDYKRSAKSNIYITFLPNHFQLVQTINNTALSNVFLGLRQILALFKLLQLKWFFPVIARLFMAEHKRQIAEK